MKLATIINRKKNNLYKEYEAKKTKMEADSLVKIQHDINLVAEILDDLNKDIANLRYIEIKSVLDLLYNNVKVKHERNLLEEQLRIIKLIFNAKYDEQLDLDITDNQRVVLADFQQMLIELKHQLENKLLRVKSGETVNQAEIDAIQDDIINLEIVHEKVLDSKREFLTIDEFQLLYKIVEDPNASYKMKKDLLIAIKRYNTNVKDNSEIDINTVKSLFEKYGVSKEIFKYIDKCWLEINVNVDLDNMIAILDYLSFEDISINKRNILSDFDVATLLAITVYGTLDSVTNTYQKIIDNKQNVKLFFQTASVWVNNLPTEKRRKRGKQTNQKRMIPNRNLYEQAHEVSYDEILNNEQFLKSKGFNVSMNQMGNIKLLKTPLYKIKENYDICELYGLFTDDKTNFSTSTLWFSNLAETCDQFIELGLCHCPDAETYPYADVYLRKYPSAINAVREGTKSLLYMFRQTMSEEKYYSTIFSKRRPGMLSIKVTKGNFDYALKTDKQFTQFRQEHFIDQSQDRYIPNYGLYEELLFKEDSYKLDEAVFNDIFIKELDEKYKVGNNDYVYVIDGQIISRLKVLRIYGVLKKNNVLFDDSKVFALTYGSYINEEIFSNLANIANYSYEGGTNGISKTI